MKRNKIIFKYLLSGLLFSVAAAPLSAQTVEAKSDSTAVSEVVKPFTITGKVLSSVDNKALEGIVVRIQGVPGSTVSASDGSFTLGSPNTKSFLEFSYPGYRTLTLFLSGATNFTVRLEPEDFPSNLETVTLTTGTFEKRYLAQSATTLKDDKFQFRGITSPEYYIQGQLAGVNVTAFNGAPGAGADIVFRAKNSIYGGSKPLYIVDGMEISQMDNATISDGSFISSLITLSPNDIESITPLKDAAAKAIYGSRGANGVIVIETFKGQKGSSQIDFSATLGTSEMRKKTLPMLSGTEHRKYMLEMALSQYDGNLGDVINNFSTALFNDPTNPNRDFIYEKYNNNTNWIDETQQDGFYQDYHFRMRGGDDVSKYLFSIGYMGNEGVMTGNALTRLSARFNLDYNITNALVFGSSLSFSQVNLDQNHQLNSDYNTLLLSMKKSPITTPYIQDNVWGINTPVLEDQDIFGLRNNVGDGTSAENSGLNNPAAISRGAYRNEYLSNAMAGKVSLDYTVSDFKFRLALGLDDRTEQTIVFIPERGFATVGDKYRTSIQGYYDNMLIDTQFDVTYHKRFNYVHDFSAKAGMQLLNNNLQYRYGRTYNAASDYYTLLSGNRDSISSRSDVWRLLGMYGTFNYVYYDRYILNATARVDASSRFGAKTKAILFPAIGAAWRIDREDFLRNSSVINELKLRVSYGLTGNDNIGNYYAKLLYQPSNYKDLGGFSIKNLANENLKPEINREFQAGLDWGLLGNKITMSVDYFNTVNSNMIVFNNIKQTAGISGAYMNVGENTNKGLEAGMNFAFKTGQVKYNLGATFAMVDTKVTKMPSATPYIENTYQGVFTARAQEGQALGSYYGYQTDGVYATSADLISVKGTKIVNGKNEKNQNVYEPFQAGDVKFVDQNKDGVINEADKVFLGDPNSDYYGSFKGNISYKGFALSALVDYQIGRDIVNGLRYELESQTDYANQTIAVNRRWRQAGDVTDMPRLSYGDPSGNNRFSDRWIEDGSFVRLRNITLSYELPTSLTKKAYLKTVTFFVTGENLLTWTKYTGLDPEFNSLNDGLLYGVDGGSMPVTRSYSAGIRIGL